ncbi:MAG: hypothetical protein K8T25_17300 [Planctomycetia bacterium]|nr:hypothetical protein [Planctomycetia bacterium]
MGAAYLGLALMLAFTGILLLLMAVKHGFDADVGFGNLQVWTEGAFGAASFLTALAIFRVSLHRRGKA